MAKRYLVLSCLLLQSLCVIGSEEPVTPRNVLRNSGGLRPSRDNSQELQKRTVALTRAANEMHFDTPCSGSPLNRSDLKHALKPHYDTQGDWFP